MPTMDTRPLRVTEFDNVDFLNAVRNGSSYGYQERVPEATQANIDDTIKALTSYAPNMNEFQNNLVNQIGLVIYKQNTWQNPLAKFKRGELNYGETIEEVIVGLLQAKSYSAQREELEHTLFGQHRPNSKAAYHKINRKDRYDLTINTVELRKAFFTEYGLSEFITQLMASPATSDQVDEFLAMSSLFRTYYDDGGFFKINVPDVSAMSSDSTESKYLLRRLRETADTLPFMDDIYNAARMPVAALPDELELFITPQANAAIDVEALAGAFNVDRANFSARKTIIPQKHMRIPGAQAILTTREFFVCADSYFGVTEQPNAAGLTTNYFLHHQEVISASLFVPAILLTSTDESTPIVINDTPVTSIDTPTFVDRNGNVVTNVTRGELYQITGLADTTPTGGDNTAVRVTLTGATSAKTYASQEGVLYVAPDETGQTLTVHLTAIDNESLDSTSASATVVGTLYVEWPNPEVLPDANNNGIEEVTPEALTVNANGDVTIPSVPHVQYKQGTTNLNNGQVVHITGATTFTAVARAGYELAAGAVASWTLTPGA